MKYDAITLDTNILRKNGYNLESGLLGQLTQFKEGSVQLVLSEIVYREAAKHLKESAREDWSKLEQSIKKSEKSFLLSSESTVVINKILASEGTPEEAARKRLEKFIETTGAIVVEAQNADMNELIKLYFAPSAPFEDNEKKKNEFPDAIALISLGTWAKRKKKKLLAVSEDKGWEAYAASSTQIDLEKDLSQAFQNFQEHVERAKQIILNLLSALCNDGNPDLLKEIEGHIEQEVQSLEPDAEADSHVSYEVDQVDIFYNDFEFIHPENSYDFTIVRIGANKIVAKIPILIRVKAEASFSLYVYDSIDKDYVSMGGNSKEVDAELDMSALITFEGDFESAPMDIRVSEVSLLQTRPTIDFGGVGFGEEWYEE
jgi:hypothetical protein